MPGKNQIALFRFSERRSHPRRSVQSLSHVNIGANRAVVSNISETGVGVHAVASDIKPHVSSVALFFPGCSDWVEIKGQIAWVSESRREAGIKFLHPPEAARTWIKEWISREPSKDTAQDLSGITQPQLRESCQSYQILEVRLDAEFNQVAKRWTECHRQFPGHSLHGDPEWIEQRFQHEKDKVRIFLLENGDQIVGAVPFVLDREKLACELGEFALLTFPMRVLRLQGHTLNMPDEQAAYDKLMGQILRSDFDAIYIEQVKTGSFLSDYLRSRALIRRAFHFYTKRGPLLHSLIRFDGTFDSYMKKFSAKTRKNRLREIKTLRDRGQVDLLRVSQPCEIDAFLETAREISQRSWQFKHFGGGLAARDPNVVRRELRFLAERGWLRSYVLKCDGVPCSFILGHQYGSTFCAESVGADHAWRRYCVGTVALLLVLENLFNENPPKLYDFGTPVKFQEYFATESYTEERVWLFRRQVYPLLASCIYRSCNAVSMSAGMILERFGVKAKLKRLLWY
ncbi:MAG TPA: GNAT family N-acetyltransferase [Terriglobales bacterium]|nr:GNAT family N-acetyltransferase [Terriglobales bacterium]